MFCFQCQETIKNQGCTERGACGKSDQTANLQDLLVYVCKGIAVYGEKLKGKGAPDRKTGRFVCEALFVTITNAAWDNEAIIAKIEEGLKVREEAKAKIVADMTGALPDCAVWTPKNREEILAKAASGDVRITATEHEDVRSLRELLVIGIKGIAAYADHAAVFFKQKAAYEVGQ